MKVVLASRSPQRRALLEALGVEFEVVEPDVRESRGGEPRQMVMENARRKAQAGAERGGKDALVIAGDTEVVVDGRALGQPLDEREAQWCLGALSGREHQVIGALCLLGPEPERERKDVVASQVRFRELEPPLLEAYLRSGEWRGRAGAYAVQGLGSALVASIEGDVSNVIGLPIGLLVELAPELLQPGERRPR